MKNNLEILEGLKTREDLLNYLESIGVNTRYLKTMYENSLRDYIKNYGHFKMGDIVRLKDGELKKVKQEIVRSYTTYDDELGIDVIDEFREDEMYEEIEQYKKFLDGKDVKIESFYNLGAVHFEGFDYGMCLYRFEHVK